MNKMYVFLFSVSTPEDSVDTLICLKYKILVNFCHDTYYICLFYV